ncbi:MAG: DUF805 domain-containing protein, partial [Chloroflexota bacterium]
LFNTLIGLLIGFIDVMVFGFEEAAQGVPYFTLLYNLFIIIPTLAVSSRRLHDTGRSGLWFLIVLVPFIGPLVLFVFFVQPSELGTNFWGPHPARHQQKYALSH